eukprot:682319-Prorocentrum_minimum.AAC.1
MRGAPLRMEGEGDMQGTTAGPSGTTTRICLQNFLASCTRALCASPPSEPSMRCLMAFSTSFTARRDRRQSVSQSASHPRPTPPCGA